MRDCSDAHVQAVIFDWAGTTVDYGSLAPVQSMTEVFASQGVTISPADVRMFMGLHKREHLAKVLSLSHVRERWALEIGGEPQDEDLDRLYGELELSLTLTIPRYCEPLPGVVDVVARLRQSGIRIGSCTGYTSSMMNLLAPVAAAKGYEPDVIVTPDTVPAGRPTPFMCWENAVRLGVYPLHTIIKIGDTVADVEEGRSAGMWSVGVVLGGSELGLSKDETEGLDPWSLGQRASEVVRRLHEAGAHYVLYSVEDLDEVIDEINVRLEFGELPRNYDLKEADVR